MSQGNTTTQPDQPKSATTAAPSAASAAAPPEAPLTIATEGVWMPRQSSTYAGPHDQAWDFYIGISIFFMLLVVGPMTYFAFKFKRKSDTEKTSPIDHHVKLEIFWTAVPTLLLIYMFWVGLKLYADAQIAPNDALQINVTGSMYSWKFQYPDGTVTQELGVPKGRPVKLTMSSIDTIHSFFVPEFRLKADVVPNLYTTMWFEPTREMESTVQCAEYCGTGHSAMLTRVMVMPTGDAEVKGTFENWLANGGEKTPLPPLALGQKKYTQICRSCHSLDGTKLVGPSFKGIWGRTETLADGRSITVDENYIRKSIQTPGADLVSGYPDQMPPMGYLKDRDIEGIIAFLKEQK